MAHTPAPPEPTGCSRAGARCRRERPASRVANRPGDLIQPRLPDVMTGLSRSATQLGVQRCEHEKHSQVGSPGLAAGRRSVCIESHAGQPAAPAVVSMPTTLGPPGKVTL
ncbi:hypothetical protein DB30_04384 [Enhygromyxa salina]|uniref:Uncharacterized protein n=1 Tax=Enhygromyxa salina TaxID=215803 RepID=A0A0C2CZR2_9BACT|nr:hypothetical protein DB30_04384 [Enhygromyxa salina]